MKLPNKNEPCPHCGRFLNRGISIDCLIIKDGKILLGKRKHDPFGGYWGIFGGYVEWDESPEDAVIRELKEETNLSVRDMKLFVVYGNPGRHEKQVITIVYVVEVEGNPTPDDDIIEIKWFDLKEIPELAFDHNIIIKDYLRKFKSG